MSPAIKNSKYVDFLFTYGSVMPSWTSPLTNFRARDGVFAGARHEKVKELPDGGLVSDPAPLWPPAALVSSFPSPYFCSISPLHLTSIYEAFVCLLTRALILLLNHRTGGTQRSRLFES